MLEVVLLQVKSIGGVDDFSEGGIAVFVDESGRSFDWWLSQELVQPSHLIPTCASMWPSYHQQVRLTWHGEARPPRGTPKVGDRMPEDRPDPDPVPVTRW